MGIGGGIVCDIAGYAASIFMRGIRFGYVSTSLLSQVDASIGGKLGIDFGDFKNHIGLFRNPESVIVCPEFLHTLNKRELRSGFAEVIKHALIADADYWTLLKNNALADQDWKAVIPKSIAIKNKVVSEDPTEQNRRKILNFGHTLGHALESFFLSSELTLFAKLLVSAITASKELLPLLIKYSVLAISALEENIFL